MLIPLPNIRKASKTGGLLHLSFVDRKPEPLGTEFKVVADYDTGILLYLEVMEGGAENMSLKNMEVLLQQPPVSVREHNYLDSKMLVPISTKKQVKR